MQKLITKEIENKTPGLYGQDGTSKEAIAYAHFFSCINGWDWYMTEYDPDTKEAFGLMKGAHSELGYFSIKEFEEMNNKAGFEVVERDIYWEPCGLSKVA